MGLMDKFKNLFTEEVEEEVETQEPIKKEMIQVEIPSPVNRRRSSEFINDEPELPKPAPMPMPEPKKEEYKFPFFDDDDFSALEKPEPKKEEKKKSSYRKESKEVYKPTVEEKKVFKPTPIISPVYGILDKNYQKEDIKAKQIKPRAYYNPKEATIDEIRNKAYGTLEDDIETTLFGHNRVLFEDEPEQTVDIMEENIKTDESMLDLVSRNEPYSNSMIGEKPRHGAEDIDSDLTDLLQEELGKVEEPKAPAKISDKELFNMIDSMYQKGDK